MEDSARALLILHAVVGATLVATATHLVVWLAKRRRKGARGFALVACLFYVAQFALGNFIYPVYRVRVRAEYLDQPAAVAAARTDARHRVQGVERAQAPEPPALYQVARTFDIK